MWLVATRLDGTATKSKALSVSPAVTLLLQDSGGTVPGFQLSVHILNDVGMSHTGPAI
jgi:hypothetical protein